VGGFWWKPPPFIFGFSIFFPYTLFMSSKNSEYKPIVDILIDIFGKYDMHNDYRYQISFDCPVCSHEIKGLDNGDGKGNLEINYKKNVFKCWSCGDTHDTHGSIYKLIKKYGNQKHLKRYELLMPEEVEILVKPKKQIILPKEYISMSGLSDAFKKTHYYRESIGYLRNRNITDDIIKKFNIGFAYEGLYSNRIIIPSYDQRKKLNYFIARSYLPRTKMKYLNPSVEKETIIFNESLIDWTKKIYLVEGVFDSIFLNNAVPLLGKHLPESLFNKIYDLGCEVTIILDGDAWDNTENLYHKMNCGKLFGKINVVKLPKDKDIADLQGNLTEYKEFKLD
jgi:DNA primase